MPADVQDLKDELKSLPARQRAELAHFLIETLDQDQDPDAVVAWDEELERRFAEIKSGRAHGIPAAELFAKIREQFS